MTDYEMEEATGDATENAAEKGEIRYIGKTDIIMTDEEGERKEGIGGGDEGEDEGEGIAISSGSKEKIYEMTNGKDVGNEDGLREIINGKGNVEKGSQNENVGKGSRNNPRLVWRRRRRHSRERRGQKSGDGKERGRQGDDGEERSRQGGDGDGRTHHGGDGDRKNHQGGDGEERSHQDGDGDGRTRHGGDGEGRSPRGEGGDEQSRYSSDGIRHSRYNGVGEATRKIRYRHSSRERKRSIFGRDESEDQRKEAGSGGSVRDDGVHSKKKKEGVSVDGGLADATTRRHVERNELGSSKNRFSNRADIGYHPSPFTSSSSTSSSSTSSSSSSSPLAALEVKPQVANDGVSANKRSLGKRNAASPPLPPPKLHTGERTFPCYREKYVCLSLLNCLCISLSRNVSLTF